MGLLSFNPGMLVLLGTGMIVEALRQAGTRHVSREGSKMCVYTRDSWSAQFFRV